MRRIMGSEAAALEAEIAVGRLGGRNGAGKLRNRDGMLLIANVDDPVREIDLVAVGVGGLAIGEHEAALGNAAIDGVKGDTHSRILRRRLKAAESPLLRGIGKIQDEQALAAESPVTAVAAVLELFRHVG